MLKLDNDGDTKKPLTMRTVLAIKQQITTKLKLIFILAAIYSAKYVKYVFQTDTDKTNDGLR